MGEDDGADAPREAPGTVIGRYTLIEEIGEGGFGIVYLAEQEAPVRRKVALKVLKPGMDTREVVARFKAERQALALMEHPHIAQVYDGGATESGRPYFVMELVDGIPITSYCSEHGLSIRQRLELFLDVTAAVQHAHQKGIIHRDLKPSNILVSSHEGNPVIKVIDFGVAKAVAMNLTETAVLTALGRMIGTPEYMSPEQADLNAVDVDTRSDIYSLGVVLYELLTETTPLDPSILREVGFSEMLMRIREDKPPKPSVRNPTLRVGKDLDWVVMQALEKDPAMRYQTANGFGLDIRRYLDDEPVSASAPSAAYRFKKFAKRHRAGVVWTGVFSVVVISAAIGMTMLYFDAQRKAKVASEQRQNALDAMKIANEERQNAIDAVKVANVERQNALDAEKVAQTTTWRSHMELAGQLRWSGKPEGRYKAFEALREAAAVTSEIEDPKNLKWLRDSVIACLSMVDMRPLVSWEINRDVGMVVADHSLETYATTFPDGGISIHHCADHGLVRKLPGDGLPVAGVLGFSPDGTGLAAGYGGEEVWNLKLWNAEGDVAAVDAGRGVRKAFGFFPDGKLCVVGRPESRVSVVDVASGNDIREYALKGVACSLKVSRTGKWIAVGIRETESARGRVEILDAESLVRIASLTCPARVVAWSPFDDSLAVGCGDGVLRLWHDEDWKSAGLELLGHAKELGAVAWSPDGRLLASQSLDGTVRLWDPFQGGAALSWHPGGGGNLQFSADGTKLGVFREGETIRIMEVESGDVCYRGRRHLGPAGVFDGAWNAGGSLLATSGDDGVRLWNREGRQLGFMKVPRARGLAFTKDSLWVASEGGLQRWGMRSESIDEELVLEFQAPETIGSFRSCGQISLSKDQHLLALAACGASDGEESAMWLIDLENGATAQRLEVPAGAYHCAFSHDGEWLAAGTLKGNGVRVWSLHDTSSPVDLPTRGAARVAFSYDKLQPVQRLVTGDSEAYRFWEIGSWERKGLIPSKMAGAMMAFSPRETVLILNCQGADLKVYAPSGLTEYSSLDFDQETPLCFDPDGRIMITSGRSGGIFFWKLDGVRSHLYQQGVEWQLPQGLDWNGMPRFEPSEIQHVKRVVLPATGF